MSALKNLISQSVAKNKDLVPMTVRVPASVQSFIEEFCENLGLSKQEALLALLQEGISQARTELNKPVQGDSEHSFHILNTNRGNNDNDHEMMLSEGIAAAFCNPWKENIKRIKVGDWVFLYENQRGIVAYGQGTGNVLSRDYDGVPEDCYYQKLEGFTTLSQPLSAKEIKQVLGRNQIFLRTMSGMPDGQKVLDKLKSLAAAQIDVV
jgi:hypothetical protein